MKVLLTGATGFLGNNVLRALVRDSHDVTILVRHVSDPRPTDGLKCEKLFGDLANPKSIASAIGEVDCVIHSAAMIQIGWTKLQTSLKVNVDATKTLAVAARRKGVRMIHVSTVDVFAPSTLESPANENCFEPQKPQCSYVVSKSKAEKAFLDEVNIGLDGVIVNPGFMVGPWDWKPSSGEMMLAVANQPVPFAPAGGCSVVDVRDVVDGILSAIQHGRAGDRYILGGDNMSYLDLWTKMAELSGRKPPRRALPDWLARAAGVVGDIGAKFLRNEPQINSAATAMGQLGHYYDSGKAKKELGYRIGSIDDALADAWDWFVEHGYTKR